MALSKIFMALILVGIATTTLADEISKKACAQFLPALGDNNIAFINNGIKRDYPENEKSGKRITEILKVVSDDVNQKTQERCDKSVYPIMDVSACYDKCKSEVAKQVPGTFAWNVSDRAAYTNTCYSTCTAAYIAQGAITKTLRKSAAEDIQCGTAAAQVFDSKKAKQIEEIMQNNPTDAKASGVEK